MVAFRALHFLQHLTVHRSYVLLKIASIVKKLCTNVTIKLPLIVKPQVDVTDN